MSPVLALTTAAVLSGCGPSLPEPESLGARVMTARCGACHRLHPPASMTLSMWEMQLERMQGVFAQRGLPWLSSEEDAALRAYLAKHAGIQ